MDWGVKLVGIAVAGSCGALARYGLAGMIARRLGPSFPWSTLAVNALGCFLFGLIWALAQEKWMISGEWRAIVLIGFIGSFTTFSTLIFETDQLLEHAEWMLAGLNVGAELGLGLLAYLAGAAVGRWI